ncbi:MAG: rRNA pseudouridine synthase [Bacilli bacterium]|nr:rRNA pseudouridine synthase [Bacilli bacterium]
MKRLQKVISEAGIASRRKAEDLIVAGKVSVNGKIITELGYKVSGNDIVSVEGKELKKEDKVYFLLNKPRGVVSTTSDEIDRKTVVELIDTDKAIFPVGRLDYDTTGLILLTNDGDFANIITHPSYGLKKTYIAKINGILNKEKVTLLKDGILVDGKKSKALRVKTRRIDKNKNTSIVEIEVAEGRNHIIKKMFNEIGYDVLKLKREKIDIFTVQGLKSGEYRKLTVKEVKTIYSYKKNP